MDDDVDVADVQRRRVLDGRAVDDVRQDSGTYFLFTRNFRWCETNAYTDEGMASDNEVKSLARLLIARRRRLCAPCLSAASGVPEEKLDEALDHIRRLVRLYKTANLCERCGRQAVLLSFHDDDE